MTWPWRARTACSRGYPGPPVFAILLFWYRRCVFIASDLLFPEQQRFADAAIDRKTTSLKKLLRRKRSRILYLDHVEGDGRLLFGQIVAMDLEGIVCKRKDSPYKITEKPSRYLDQGQEFTV
jgi:hypothetical protein